MLLSNHDCIVIKLSERSCRLFGAFKGSEMEFSTKTLIVCCGYGKMCLHAFDNWSRGCKKKRAVYGNVWHSSFTLGSTHSHWHTKPCYQLTVWREGRAGSTELRTVAESLGQTGLDFPVLSLNGDTDGMRWAELGGILQNERRADTSSTVSYIFSHSPINTSSTETKLQIVSSWGGRWHEDKDCGKDWN